MGAVFRVLIRRLGLLLAVLLSLPAWAQTYAIHAEDAAGLWGQADGTGCANDIVKAAFQASGAEVTLLVTPYGRAKALVMEGRSLACFGMSWSEELEGKVVLAAEPLYRNTCILLIRRGDSARFRRIQDIPRNTRLGTVRGYEYPTRYWQMVKEGIFQSEEAGSEVQNLKKLASGRIDMALVMLDGLKSAEYLCSQAGVSGLVETPFNLGISGTYLGFSRSHPDHLAAKAAFDRGMAAIQNNGTLAKILAKWKAKR